MTTDGDGPELCCSPYLQDSVKGFEASAVSRPLRSDHVHVNSFFQEAV